MWERAALPWWPAPRLAGAVFLLALAGVLARWEWMEHADWAVLGPLNRYGVAHPGWVTAWDVLCTVFHPAVFRLVALIWIVYLLMGRRPDRYRVALFLALTVEFSALIVVFAKAVVSRPRPATALVPELSSSLPVRSRARDGGGGDGDVVRRGTLAARQVAQRVRRDRRADRRRGRAWAGWCSTCTTPPMCWPAGPWAICGRCCGLKKMIVLSDEVMID